MKRLLSIPSRLWLIGACLLAAALLTPLGVGARQEPPPTPQGGHERDYGSWRYSVGRAANHGRLDGYVYYDNTSINGLRAYAAANRILANQLASAGGTAEMQVTFRAPMAPDAFRAWAAASGLTVGVVDIRMVDTTGNRSTIGLFPRGGDPLPQAVLEN